MSCWAIVPIKERAACKRRLAPALPPLSRQHLVDRLLNNVLRALRCTRGIDRVALVSPEHHHIDGVTALMRGRVGLNEDLDFAVSAVGTLGARSLVIVPPDLPFLETVDITALITSAQSHGAAIAPDHKGYGTNGLAFDMSCRLRLSFGPDSFREHLASGRAAGFEPAIVRRPGFAFDVDEPEDWRQLSQHPDWSSHPAAQQRRHAVV